jgi:hypothetical protein
MNKQGHVETLVAAHPGNTNAAKTGVFSPRTRAPRVAELEAAIGGMSAAEVCLDIARRDLAGVTTLVEALDAALANSVVGRRRQVSDLVRMRLRASTVLRGALLEYSAAVAAVEERAQAAAPPERDTELAPVQGDVLAELAEKFQVASLAEVDAGRFDAELFLQVIAETTDPTAKESDRNRADRLLLKRRAAEVKLCGCRPFRPAVDAVEFGEWVSELRSHFKPIVINDRFLAGVVRAFARGEQPEPAVAFARTRDALMSLVDYELRRAHGEEVHEGGQREAEEDMRVQRLADDHVFRRYWRTLLSPDTKVVKARLDAYDKLERAGALRRCVCTPVETHLKEIIEDEEDAFVIRGLARTSMFGAKIRVQFPETFVAVREILDEKILAERAVDNIRDNANATEDATSDT